MKLLLPILAAVLLVGCHSTPKVQPRPVRTPDTSKATAAAVTKELDDAVKRMQAMADELLKNLESPTLSIPEATMAVKSIKEEAAHVGEQSSILKDKLLPELDKHDADMAELDKWAQGQWQRAEDAEKDVKEYKDGTRKAVTGWGIIAIVGGAAAIGLGVWLLIVGGGKVGAWLIVGGGCGVGTGAFIIQVGEHLVITGVVTGVLVLAGLAYLIISRVGKEGLKRAFGIVAKAVDVTEGKANEVRPTVAQLAEEAGLTKLVEHAVKKAKATREFKETELPEAKP